MNVQLSNSTEEDAIITLPPRGEAGRDTVWLTVRLGHTRPILSVGLRSTDEGMVVDVWPFGEEAGEPLASTYVFDSEIDVEEPE